MESIFLPSNKWACTSSSAVSAVTVKEEDQSNQMAPLPWLNQPRWQSEGNRKRSHQRAFDSSVLTLTSTDDSSSSTFLMDTKDSDVKVSSHTSSDKRPHRTVGNNEHVHIGSDDEGNSNFHVPVEQHNNLSNDIGIRGTFLSNRKDKSCIVTSKTNTDVKESLPESGKQMNNWECASESIAQQEHGKSHEIGISRVEHNWDGMEILGGSSNATSDVSLNSTPSSSKKQRKRRHSELELKIQLISVHQAPVCVPHSGAQGTDSPYPYREFTDDIDPRSTSNDCTNPQGSREFSTENTFASKADTSKKIKLKSAENHLYDIRQPSVFCKPSLGRESLDQVSPLAEGYKLQDGVYKIPCLKDGIGVKKSHNWEESLHSSYVSNKSKTIPFVQQQNNGCLTSHNVFDQPAILNAPCSINANDKNNERQKFTTEITYEIGGLHLNDRALQASSSPSFSISTPISITNEECRHTGSQKAYRKTRSLKSDEKPNKSNQNVKTAIGSRDSERWMDIENLSQRIKTMSTLDTLDQLTASFSFNKNKHKYDNKKPVQSKPKGMMVSKQLTMDPAVFRERQTTVTSDIPVKFSHIYELERDGDPSSCPFPSQSKQSKGDIELVNLNNSSSEKINTNFNAVDAAAETTNKAVNIKAAVTESLSFKEVITQSAHMLENTSKQGGSERTRKVEKIGSKFVYESNTATTTTEKEESGNVTIQKTSDLSMIRSKHIITAVIVNKDTNREDSVCQNDSTEVTDETKNKKSNISFSTVHALGGSDKNKQSNTKTTHLVSQVTKRKDKTAYVPVPLTPHIYRYLVENAGVVVKPLIPPACRNGTNQIVGRIRINHKSNVSNPKANKCGIPTKTITTSKLTKSANIILGNIANKPPLVTMNIDDHSYTRPSVFGDSNILTILKYSPLATQNIPVVENDYCNRVQQKLNVCAFAGTSLKQEENESVYVPCHSKLSALSSEVEKSSITETVLNNTVAKQERKIKRASQIYLGNDETKVVNIQPESVISKVQTFFSSIKVKVEPYALKCGERMFLIAMPAMASNQRTSVGLTYEQVTIPQPLLPESELNRLKSVTDEFTKEQVSIPQPMLPESALNRLKSVTDEFTKEQVSIPQPMLPETVFSRLKSVTDNSTKHKIKQRMKNTDKNGTKKNNNALKMLQKMTVVLPKYPGKMDKFINALVLRSIEPKTISADKTLRKKSSSNQCGVPDGVNHLFTLKNLNVSERKHATAMMTVSNKDEFHCQSSLSVVKIVQIFKESESECRFYMQYISMNLTTGPSQGYHRWFQFSDYPCRIYFHYKIKDEITHIDIESSRPGFYLISGARTDDFPIETSSINVILSPYPPCLHSLPEGSMAIAIGKLVLSKDLPEGATEKKSKCLTTSRGIINVLQMVLDKESFKDLFNLNESRYTTDFSKDLSPKIVASKFYGPELFDHFTPRRHRYASRKVKQQAKEENTNCNI